MVGRRIGFIAALSCVLVVLTVSVEAGQQRAHLSKDLSDRLAARVEAPTDVIVAGSDEQIEALATRYGARVKKRLRNAAVLEVSGGQLRDLSEDAEVASLSGDVPVRAMATVTAEAIGADQVWTGASQGLRGFTGRGIGVAVIDTGVDARHPYLASRVALSLDFTGASVQRSPGRDENGHGTHVAGIIRDIAPGAHIVDLKAMGADGSGFTSNVIAALNWAIDNKAAWNLKIVNISLGHGVMESENDDPLCQAVQRATDAGMLVTVAAGNVGKLPDGRAVVGGIHSPGNSRHALTVGALNTKQTAARSDDVMATYSSRGPTMIDGVLKPELVAPGNRIRVVGAAGRVSARAPARAGDRARGQRVHGVERDEHVGGGGGRGGGAAAGGAVADAAGGEGGAAADEQRGGRERPARSRRREPERGRGGDGGEATSRYFNRDVYRERSTGPDASCLSTSLSGNPTGNCRQSAESVLDVAPAR